MTTMLSQSVITRSMSCSDDDHHAVGERNFCELAVSSDVSWWLKTGGRLVEQQHARVHHERAAISSMRWRP